MNRYSDCKKEIPYFFSPLLDLPFKIIMLLGLSYILTE